MTNQKENSMVKFVDTLPPSGNSGKRGSWDNVVSELRAHPGNWAEVKRGVRAEQSRIASTGSLLKRRAGIEAVTRTEGDEVVLYARAIS